MDPSRSHRRDFLKATGAAMAVAASGGVLSASPRATQRPRTSAEALALLKTGNDRFVHGKTNRKPVTPQALAELEKGQYPFATIIGCSDSRVPTELIFDQGLGDLFVIRLAGNVIDPDVEGSLEYAFAHLDTRLIMVMGHEGCGAVTAALAAKEEQEKEMSGIQQLVSHIGPAIEGIDPNLPKSVRIHLGVEANVRNSVEEIMTFPGHQEAYEKGLFDVVGAVYEMHTGKVRILDVNA